MGPRAHRLACTPLLATSVLVESSHCLSSETSTFSVPRDHRLLSVLMSAVVSTVVARTTSPVRGYLQRPIERRHGPVIAILVTGSLFGLVHFSHPEVTLVLLPYYMAVAAVYGALAHFTDSTLPSMLLHGGGNALSAFDLFARGRSEWQLSAAPTPLVWEAGPDAAFVASAVGLVVVGAATVWAYSGLSHAARTARRSAAE